MFSTKRSRVLASLFAIGGMLSTGIAMADNVYNDLDGTIDTDLEIMNLTVSGADGTVHFLVEPVNGDGKNGCNFQGSESLTVSLSINTAIATVSPTSLVFDNCNDSKTVTVHPVAAGSTNVTLTQTANTTGDTFVYTTGSFTVNVSAAPVNGHIVIDKVTDPAADPQVFSFDAVGGSYADFTLTDAGTPNDQGLVAGAYSVSETVPSGWNQTGAACISSMGHTETIGSISLQAGEIVTCTFTNTKLGKIIVDKVTNPSGDSQSFGFNPSYGSSFNLSDGDTPDDSGFLAPGLYSVSEDAEAGWDLTTATCDDDSDPSSIGLDPGEIVTCTFTNTKKGHIIVDTVTNPLNDPQVFDFSVTGAGYSDFSLADADLPNDQEVPAGTYSVSEDALAEWDLTSATCDNGSPVNAIEIDPGETVTCTFTNTKKGHIIVDKVTDPAGDVQSFSFDASGGSYSDFSLADSDAPNDQVLSAGTYGISEDALTGWDLTTATCSDGSPINAIDLGVAETVTCTFTNTKRGTIIVEKQTDPDADPTLFTFTGNAIGSISDGQQIVMDNLVPGIYSATEVAVPGWKVASIVCTEDGIADSSGLLSTATFTLQPGETVTCVFNNEKLPVTRGQGFWKNHTAFSTTILGSGITVGTAGPHQKIIDTPGKLMGAFISSIPYKSNGKTKRGKEDQSRMQLLQQLVTTKLNCKAWGCNATILSLVANADAAYSGNNINTMLSYMGQLGSYNGSGESTPIPGPQPGFATPDTIQSIALKTFWDTL